MAARHAFAVARLDQLAGLECSDATTKRIAWTRDPVDVWAFHFDLADGVSSLVCRFDFLSPLDGQQSREVMTPVIVGVQWNQVLLYPASYDASRIQFKARITRPTGFSFATALESDTPPASYPRNTTGPVEFKPVDLETLVDSPLFSGRYMRTFDLDPRSSQAGRAPDRSSPCGIYTNLYPVMARWVLHGPGGAAALSGTTTVTIVDRKRERLRPRRRRAAGLQRMRWSPAPFVSSPDRPTSTSDEDLTHATRFRPSPTTSPPGPARSDASRARRLRSTARRSTRTGKPKKGKRDVITAIQRKVERA